MKRCPQCRRDYYDDTLLYCLDDGSALLEGPGSGEATTAVISPPESVRTGTDTDKTKIYHETKSGSQQIGSRGLVTGIAAVMGVIVLSAAGYGLYRFVSDSPAPQPQRSDAAIKVQRLTGDGKTRGAEISPDGKFLAYIRTEGGERSIWLKQIQTNSNIPIIKPGELDGFDGITFSPDGNFVYFNAETKAGDAPSVYKVPTLGGTPTKVLTNAHGIQFSPDGRQVSFGRYDFAANESAVFLADVNGTNERKLAGRSGTQYFDGSPVWSPDGSMIAMAGGDDALSPNPNKMVLLISVATGETRELGTSRWIGGDDIVWHPAGDALVIAANDSQLGQPQLWEIAYPSGNLRRLTNNLNGHYSVSLTADGKSLVTGEIYSRSAVWVSPDLKPENAKQVMPSTGDTWGFSWTPDNRIVYASDQTGDAELWIMDADGANAKPLTNDKVTKAIPVVSPDGRLIFYATNQGITRVDINGGNPMLLVTSPGADNPDVSPDGKWVLYSAWIGGISRILRVSIDGGEPQVLIDYGCIEPRYSRDGTRFACFVPNEKTQNWTRLAIVPAEGGPPIKVFDVPPNTNIVRGPIWTPDDSGITTVVASGELQNLWLQPVAGGEGRMMTNFQVPGIARRDYSRDGKRIAIVRAEGFGNAIMITDFR